MTARSVSSLQVYSLAIVLFIFSIWLSSSWFSWEETGNISRFAPLFFIIILILTIKEIKGAYKPIEIKEEKNSFLISLIVPILTIFLSLFDIVKDPFGLVGIMFLFPIIWLAFIWPLVYTFKFMWLRYQWSKVGLVIFTFCIFLPILFPFFKILFGFLFKG